MKKALFLSVAIFLVLIGIVLLPGHLLSYLPTLANARQPDTLPEEPVVEFTRPSMATLKINFQDSAVTTPVGWIKDFGLPFGVKPGVFELGSLQYGWKKRDDGTPINFVSNSRNRNNPDDVLLE